MKNNLFYKARIGFNSKNLKLFSNFQLVGLFFIAILCSSDLIAKSFPNQAYKKHFVNKNLIIAAEDLSEAEILIDSWKKFEIDKKIENSIQIFSHGKPGSLLINGKWLNQFELSNYFQELFYQIDFAVESINIYGCNFAKGEEGLAVVKFLEAALNVKINASTNTTGIDGDWVLEIGNQNNFIVENYEYNLQFPCERVSGGSFSVATDESNWTKSAGSTWHYNDTHNRIQSTPYANGTANDSLYQTLSNLPNGSFTLSFNIWSNRHDNRAGFMADMWIYIDGVEYAHFQNTTANALGTITTSNGATSNATNFNDHDWNGAGENIELTIPYSGPSTADLVFKMTAPRTSVNCGFFCTSWGADYFALNDISILGKQTEVTNITCNQNGTVLDLSDDYIGFDLNATPGTGSYNISNASGSVTPSTGAFGAVTTFQLQNGSAGAGDPTILLTDPNDSNCTFEVIVPDPGCCLATCDNIIVDGDFDDPVSAASNWNTTGGWSFIGSKVENSTNNATGETLSQTLNGIGTSPFTLSLDVFGQNYNNQAGHTATVELYLNGTLYTTFENTNANAPGNVIASNGATVSSSTFAINQFGSPTNIEITIPWSGPNSAMLEFVFNAPNNTVSCGFFCNSTGADDFAFDNLRIEKAAKVENIVCNNNGTVFDATDDYLTFDLNPIGSGTYNISTNQGTVSPSTGTFGSATTFTYNIGGTEPGIVNFNVVDITETCKFDIAVFNPGDCLPGPCGTLTDWNLPAEKANITVSTTHPHASNVAFLCDGNDTGDNFYYSDNQPIAGNELIKYEFPNATAIQGFEIMCSGRFIFAGAELIAQGSNNDSIWVDLETINIGTPETSTAQWGGTGTVMSFPFLNNQEAYKFYRLLGVTGTTESFNWVRETYFNFVYTPTNLDNELYLDNGTANNLSDDTISFELNPNFESPSIVYQIEMENNLEVIPSSGISDSTITFKIPGGTFDQIGFQLINLIDLCVLNDTIINPACFPDYQVNVLEVTCSNAMSNDDASLVLNSSDDNVSKVDFSVGGSYSGPDYASAVDVLGVFPIVLQSGIANPDYDQPYTVRLFCDANNYTDTVVLLQRKECSISDLRVNMIEPTQTANVGEFVTYSVEVENLGPHLALDVEILVDVPLNADFASASPTLGSYSSGDQIWSFDQLPVGTETLTITYIVK